MIFEQAAKTRVFWIPKGAIININLDHWRRRRIPFDEQESWLIESVIDVASQNSQQGHDLFVYKPKRLIVVVEDNFILIPPNEPKSYCKQQLVLSLNVILKPAACVHGEEIMRLLEMDRYCSKSKKKKKNCIRIWCHIPPREGVVPSDFIRQGFIDKNT